MISVELLISAVTSYNMAVYSTYASVFCIN